MSEYQIIGGPQCGETMSEAFVDDARKSGFGDLVPFPHVVSGIVYGHEYRLDHEKKTATHVGTMGWKTMKELTGSDPRCN